MNPEIMKNASTIDFDQALVVPTAFGLHGVCTRALYPHTHAPGLFLFYFSFHFFTSLALAPINVYPCTYKSEPLHQQNHTLTPINACPCSHKSVPLHPPNHTFHPQKCTFAPHLHPWVHANFIYAPLPSFASLKKEKKKKRERT